MSTTIKVYDEALHRQVEEYMAAHQALARSRWA